MTQIVVSQVAIEYGSTTLLQDVTFTVGAGDKWGIVGRNGTGKTSLFRLLTGAQAPTRGAVSVTSGLRVVLLEQHRDFGEATTVWEAAAGEFAELFALERSLEAQATRLGELGEATTPEMLDRYAHDLERFEREGGYTIAPRVDAVLDGLGFDPVAARTQLLARLSGGERGRVGLARQLVAPADVLLLDEPTNHLDLDTTRWLERYLRDTERTVVVISHDRDFLATVIDHVLHVEDGTAVPYNGGYEAFVLQRAERRLSQQRSFDKQKRTIAAEEDYIRRNIAGQNSKQAKGRRTRLERVARLSPPVGDDESMSLRLEVNERGGDQVLVADHATISVGDRVLVRDFSTVARRGERIGLVGPNGAGKSTLLKTIVGEREPASGLLRVGSSMTVAHYRQDLTQVPLEKTIYETIADLRPQWGRGPIQGHLGRFGFSGDEVLRRPGTLSGGERARVALAMMMLAQANLLILDEPTNHLDVESIEALEDAIERYDGTVLLVSHDRALLRALATRVWVLHDQRITVFDGSFAEWEVVAEEQAHAASVKASEQESLRRVQERQRTQKSQSRDGGNGASSAADRAQARQAQRAVESAEKRVETAEQRVVEITATLEDPELYVHADGHARAAALGQQLDRARAELDAAIAEWTVASETADALSR